MLDDGLKLRRLVDKHTLTPTLKTMLLPVGLKLQGGSNRRCDHIVRPAGAAVVSSPRWPTPLHMLTFTCSAKRLHQTDPSCSRDISQNAFWLAFFSSSSVGCTISADRAWCHLSRSTKDAATADSEGPVPLKAAGAEVGRSHILHPTQNRELLNETL